MKNKWRVIFSGLAVLLATGGIIYHYFQDYDLSAGLTKPGIVSAPEPLPKISRLGKIKHVFIIMEENRNWNGIYGNSQAPYINRMAKEGAYATDYHNISPGLGALHPSEPNYILLEAGKIAFADVTFTTDNPPSRVNSTISHEHLASLLENAGFTWKAYQEGISGDICPIFAQGDYAPKHNPFVFFQDVSGSPPDSTNENCIQHIRPLTELAGDLRSGEVPNYVFITPGLKHDMHDGSITEADTWLSEYVPMITDSEIFKTSGALFVTWDEGGGAAASNETIGMVIVSPFAKKGYTSDEAYSHASYVKTVQEIFGLDPLLGLAADTDTADLSDFFAD